MGVDNAPGGAQALSVSPLGTLTASCNDQAAAVGTENPTTTITFTNTTASAVNFARAVGGNNATAGGK